MEQRHEGPRETSPAPHWNDRLNDPRWARNDGSLRQPGVPASGACRPSRIARSAGRGLPDRRLCRAGEVQRMRCPMASPVDQRAPDRRRQADRVGTTAATRVRRWRGVNGRRIRMTSVAPASRPSGGLPESAVEPRAAFTRRRWHFRKVPCVDGSPLARVFFTFAAGSVQPCVRPTWAVPMTAGHNALRESGPGQKHAFKRCAGTSGLS